MNINKILKAYEIVKQKPTPTAGHVTWCALAPTTISYQTHKFSLLDAFETAAVFAFTALQQQKPEVKESSYWIVVGIKTAVVVITLPQMVLDNEDHPAAGLHYLGWLNNKPVFADSDADPYSFVVGNEHFCTSGNIVESTF